MKHSIWLVVTFLCVIVVRARVQQFENVDPIQDRGMSIWNDWEYSPSQTSKRDRMCLINAGLSQGCDLSDVLWAKQQQITSKGDHPEENLRTKQYIDLMEATLTLLFTTLLAMIFLPCP